MRLGWTEVLVILGVILVFFGGRRLPELGRALGKALKGFREGAKEGGSNVDASLESLESNASLTLSAQTTSPSDKHDPFPQTAPSPDASAVPSNAVDELSD